MGTEGSFPDFTPSGNAATDPVLYDIENAAMDPSRALWTTMRRIAPWAEKTLLDLGCGTGFWLARYVAEGAEVVGIEPDPLLLELAKARNVGRVLRGSAEHLPLEDESVDVVHARFAYFFPPGVERGLTEVLRTLRVGGSLVVVDNDLRHGDFATLLVNSAPAAAQGHAETTDAWWAAHGAARHEVMSSWEFADREHFAAVLRLEFPDELADAWLEAHPDATGISYGYVLFSVVKAVSD